MLIIIVILLNRNINNSRANIESFYGETARREALKDANFVVNAIQVGGYKPSTVIDFELPKKYDVVMFGSPAWVVYPFRYRLAQLLNKNERGWSGPGDDGNVVIPHPGYTMSLEGKNCKNLHF